MSMIALLIVIASLTLVEGYSTKSEIRFGYGLLYEHRGQLLHGLNKYHLLVGVEMPKFTFTQYSYQLEQHLNCRHFINMTVLYNVCYSLVPLCINYRTKELQYHDEISQILESDLPAIMPTFNGSRVEPQPHGRNKRFVGTLARIVFGGVNAFINHKKHSALQKGMKQLLTRQKVNEGKITALGTHMVSIAQTTLKEINRLQKDIADNNKRLRRLTQRVMQMQVIIDKFIWKVSDNANAIRFLAFILGRISANMERNLSKYQQLLADLDHLMDGLDSLSSGLLSHSIIPPGKLAELLEHVNMELIEHFKEYELAMTEIHQYYDLPLVSYSYTDGMLILQIPIYIKHYQQQTLELFSLQTVPVPYHPNSKSSDDKQAYTWLKPDHDMLAMSSSTYLALDSKQLPNCRRFSTIYYCENLFLVTHRSEHTCESAIYWNESANLINEKCNFEYYHELTPEPRVLDAGDYLLLAGLPIPWTFFCTKERQIPNPTEGSPYIIIKRTQLCLCSISAGPYYLQENVLSCEDENVDLHMYYTVNMAVVNHFGTQIPEIEQIDGHMQIETMNANGKELNDQEDQFTVSDVLLSENPVILTVKDLQVESYEDEEVLIEYTLANPIPFKDVVECVINDEKVHLTKEDLALSNTKIENWFTSQNKWLAVVLIASIIGILSFIIGMIMVKKWFSVKNTVTTINTSVSRVTKQLTGALTLLNTIRGAESTDLNECQENYIIKIGLTWHEILILVIYEVIILMVIVLIVKLVKHVHRLCNFNNLQMPDSYVKQNCCPIRMLGNRSDIYLELSSITNISSIRLYIGTTMGYPTQFSMTGKLTKGDMEYHTSILYDEINFDWSKIEFRYQNEPIFFPSTIQVPLHGKFKTREVLACLDPQYRIVIQCQNIVHVLNEHEKVLKELTESTECNINDSHNDIIEELIQIDTNASVSNKDACKSVSSDQKVENQDENMTQIEVQIESGPQSLRKIECTHCKNYIYI